LGTVPHGNSDCSEERVAHAEAWHMATNTDAADSNTNTDIADTTCTLDTTSLNTSSNSIINSSALPTSNLRPWHGDQH